MNRPFAAVLPFVLVILNSSALAQTEFSFSPQPLPGCRAFAVTELGLGYRLTPLPRTKHITVYTDETGTDTSTSYEPAHGSRLLVTADFGMMWNLNENYALGGSCFLSLSPRFRSGARLRIRRWLSARSSLDFLPGVVLERSSGYHSSPGFTGSIDLKIEEWLALMMTVEYFRGQRHESRWSYDQWVTHTTRESEDDIGVYLGARSGSYPGAVAAGATFAFIGLLTAALLLGAAG